MNELITWIEGAKLTVNARSAARAFWNCGIKTLEDVIKYLIDDKECVNRPKGLGEENYKALVKYANEFAVNNEPTFVGITCSNGVSFSGQVTKQDYAELTGLVEALSIWFEAHKIG